MFGIYHKNETVIRTFDKLRTTLFTSGNRDDQDSLEVRIF